MPQTMQTTIVHDRLAPFYRSRVASCSSVSVSVTGPSVSVAVSPSVAEGVGRSTDDTEDVETARSCEAGLSLVFFADPEELDARGARCASSFFWPYVLSMSAWARQCHDGSTARTLTGVLEEDQETELCSMGCETDEQDQVAPDDQREAIVPRIPYI